MLDPLFEIGNHTETHRNLRLATPEVARQEILAPQKIYEDTRAASRDEPVRCIAGYFDEPAYPLSRSSFAFRMAPATTRR